MNVDRLYHRLGQRYVKRFVVSCWTLGLAGGVLLCVMATAYLDFSLAQWLGGLALAEIGIIIAGGINTYRWLPVTRAIEDWVRDGRPADRATEVWRRAARLPMLSPLLAYPLGVAFIALPLAVYTWAIGKVSVGDAVIVFAGVSVGGVYVGLLLYFATDVYLRPVLRDLAQHMPASFRLERPGMPLQWKLFAALLLISLGTGGVLAVLVGMLRGSLEETGLILAVAVVVTLSCTLLLTTLVTGSFSTPIADLLRGMRRVAGGDLRARVRITTDDEIGVLAGSFNEMTADLQRSRGRLVTAREEERRRVRRDLHDGLGPALAGMGMRLDAAAELLERDPEAARSLLAEIRRETGEAIADIRRLVYALRPPQLDQLGLVGAIKEHATQLALEGAENSANGLRVTVEAPRELAPLPAAVEVAAYRIAQEALANVVRHAAAQSCTVRLALDGALELEVRDDGGGVSGDHRAGVGLASMRERAAELGGTCTIEPAAGGGTLVRARLPLPEDTPA